jgi:glutaminyl-tRNA synthetase
LNPHSLEVLQECQLEPSLASALPGQCYQFERLGYFCADAVEFTAAKPVFNRTVTLRDTWAKIARSQPQERGA